jgi:hypothetical protein
MADKRTYIVQFFRLSPGDIPIRNISVVTDDLEALERTASKALIANFLDEQLLPSRRPSRVYVTDDTDGSITLRLVVTEKGDVGQFP